MNVQQRDLTEGPLAKQILFFSLPLILSNLLQVLFNMADVAVVGRFAGSAALGSVGLHHHAGDAFYRLPHRHVQRCQCAGGHHFGARDAKNLSDTVHSAAILCALVGIFLLAAGSLLARPF